MRKLGTIDLEILHLAMTENGTFNENKAHEITNDIQHCKELAKNNTSFLNNIVYWIGSVEAETKYQALYRKCLINRGHSVLN